MKKGRRFTLNLTGPELDQILAYCEDWEKGPMAGWYYGDPRHFKARHARIVKKIHAAINAFPLRAK